MTGTWNPSDNNGLSFSNNNLTATNLTGSGVWYTCRATPYFTAQNKVYAEFTASNVGVSDNAVYLAVMNGNAALSLPGATDANSTGYNQNGSTTYNGNGPTLATWTTNNIICVAADATAGKVWWRVNNGNWNNDGTGQADPSANVGGISCPNVFAFGPIYFGVSIHTINYAITGNFNGTFTYAVPSGFAALPPVTSVLTTGAVAVSGLGAFKYTQSHQMQGAGASHATGTLLATTSAIRSIAATGNIGYAAGNISYIGLLGTQGRASSNFGSIAIATLVYNYEGFDHENAQIDLGNGILSNINNCSASINSNTPYSQGSSLALSVPNNTGNVLFNSGPYTLKSAVLGVMTQSNIYANTGTDIGFVNGTTTQIFCRISGGNIIVCRGSPSSFTIIQTLLNVVPSIGWFYLELSAVIAPSNAGSLTISINGTTCATLTSITTSSDGTSAFSAILLGGLAGVPTTFLFDDIYVARSVLGPSRIFTSFPTGNGQQTQFLSASTTFVNWQEINDRVMDFDTSYNYTSTFALIDEFSISPIPTSLASIVAMKVTMAARRDSESTRSMSTLLYSNSVVAKGESIPLTPVYTYYSDIYLVDPQTGNAWTSAGINASQIGYTIR